MDHQPFEPDGDGGLLFDMTGARNPTPDHHTKNELENDIKRLVKLKEELDRLHDELQPVYEYKIAPAGFPGWLPPEFSTGQYPLRRMLGLPDEPDESGG